MPDPDDDEDDDLDDRLLSHLHPSQIDALVTTRSNENVDAHRDFDNFDVEEELRRLRQGLRSGNLGFCREAFSNLDEWLSRNGRPPSVWSPFGTAEPGIQGHAFLSDDEADPGPPYQSAGMPGIQGETYVPERIPDGSVYLRSPTIAEVQAGVPREVWIVRDNIGWDTGTLDNHVLLWPPDVDPEPPPPPEPPVERPTWHERLLNDD